VRRVSRSVGIYVAALATVLAVLTAIGCGGSEGDERLTVEEYQAERLDIRDDFASAYERFVVGGFDQPSLVELAIVCDEFGGIVNDLAVRLEPLDPPAGMTSSHAKLVEGFQEFGSFLHDLATKIRTLPAAQAEKLVNETFSGGTFDPSRVPAAAKIDDALGEDAANRPVP
jgi:hypothetical protein